MNIRDAIKKLEGERDTRLNEIRVVYDRKIKKVNDLARALEVEIFGERKAKDTPTLSEPTRMRRPRRTNNLYHLVVAAVNETTGQFTAKGIARAIRKAGHMGRLRESSIRQVLLRLGCKSDRWEGHVKVFQKPGAMPEGKDMKIAMNTESISELTRRAANQLREGTEGFTTREVQMLVEKKLNRPLTSKEVKTLGTALWQMKLKKVIRYDRGLVKNFYEGTKKSD